jgi:hypothetical protein
MHSIKSHEIKLANAFTSSDYVRPILQLIEITPTQLIATDSYKVIFVERSQFPDIIDSSKKEYMAKSLSTAIAKSTTSKNAKDNHANLPIETSTGDLADGVYPNCKQVVDDWSKRDNSTNQDGDLFSIKQLAEMFTALHAHNKLIKGNDKIAIRIADYPDNSCHALIFKLFKSETNGILMGCHN